jgi:hypothetical protein
MAHSNTSKKHGVALHTQPITERHKPFVANDKEPLKSNGTARATIAAIRDAPNGTTKDGWAASHQNHTVNSLSA